MHQHSSVCNVIENLLFDFDRNLNWVTDVTRRQFVVLEKLLVFARTLE